MSRKSWNPLELLADVVEGEIFEGEPVATKVTANEPDTTTARAPAGKQEQTEGSKPRKPAASLADAFTDAGGAVESITVTASDAAAAPATSVEGDDKNS